jgi:hypothetical protein
MNQDPYTNPQQPYSQGSANNLPPENPQQPAAPYNQVYSQQTPQQQTAPNPYYNSQAAQPQQPVYSQQAPNLAANQPPDQFLQTSQTEPTYNTGPQPLNAFPVYTGNPNDDYNTVDYLNRIAPQEQHTINRIAIFALIGTVIASVIIILIMIINPGAADTNSLIQPIRDRTDTLNKVVDENEGRLTQTEITEANTALNSTLTAMQTRLDAIIKERKIQKKSSSTEKSYLEALQKKLNDSYQKGKLDSSYATAMTYELTILKSQLNKLKKVSDSKSIRSFCDESINNINVILKAYHDFASTKQ